MFTAAGVALCALVCLVTVREVRREWEPYLLLGFALFFFFLTLPGVRESVTFAAALTDRAGDGASVILRALGIAWMTSAAGELCRASGEGALAGYVEGVGRVELLVLSLPLLRDLLALAGLS
jgi:hypothetical protein